MSAATTLRMAGVPAPLTPDREYATSKGLSLEQVGKLWEGHVEGSRSRGFDTFGGVPWRRYVDAAVDRMNEDGSRAGERVSDQAMLLQLRREARERAEKAAEEAYSREAIGITEYLDSLMMKPGKTPPEQRLMLHAPEPGELAGAFMGRVFATPLTREDREALGEDAYRVTARAQRCPCGEAARSWLYEGRRYYGARCGTCERQERSMAEARREGNA